MAPRQHAEPVGQFCLKLTAAQRELILSELTFLDRRLVDAVRAVSPGQPLWLSSQCLDDLAQYVAAELVLTKDNKVRPRLDRLYSKVANVREEAGVRTAGPARLRKLHGPSLLRGPFGAACDRGQRTFVPVRLAGTKLEPGLRLTQWERESLIRATRSQPAVQQRLAEAPYGTQFLQFSRRELAQLRRVIEKAVPLAPSPHKKRLQGVVEKISEVTG
jgi:hypothetical protein